MEANALPVLAVVEALEVEVLEVVAMGAVVLEVVLEVGEMGVVVLEVVLVVDLEDILSSNLSRSIRRLTLVVVGACLRGTGMDSDSCLRSGGVGSRFLL